MKYLTSIFVFCLFILVSVLPLHTVTGQSSDSPILFIYDASGSMWGKLNNVTKKEAAADVLIKTIDALDNEQKIGFMAYGHRTKGDCEDVEMLVDIENTNKSVLKTNIEKLNPLGKTPLAHSAKLAINEIKDANTKATIILVTDGIESCNGDLCEVIRLARQEGIEFKLHIVGFGLKESETEALRCAAKEGDGNYYDADDAYQLSEALDKVINQKIDDPIPNHTFYTTKNGQPVDAWIKVIDAKTKKEIRAVRTYRDTAQIHLPLGKFSLTINPLEGTDIASKTMEITKTDTALSHNTISFDGGVIEVFITNNNEGRDATIKVIDRHSQKVVSTSRTYGRKKNLEVNAGNYDVEIIPLVIKGPSLKYKFENIVVTSNETNSISHDYKTGELKIGVSTQSGELVDAAIKIVDSKSQAYMVGGRTYVSPSSNPKSIIIQPGKYEVRINTLGKHKGTTKTDIVEVLPNKTTTKIFKIE